MKKKLILFFLSLLLISLASESVFATEEYFTFEIGSILSEETN